MLALDVRFGLGWHPDAPAKWRSALNFAATHLAVDGGFDFTVTGMAFGSGDREASLHIGSPAIRSQRAVADDARCRSDTIRLSQRNRAGRVQRDFPSTLQDEADFFYSDVLIWARPHGKTLAATA